VPHCSLVIARDADSLFKNAQTALKNAKKSGDRHLFYTLRMTATVANKLSLENRLRDVLVIEMQTKEGLELVSTIIRVARALKLKVVAEGIETKEQLRQISALNCDQMQGYLLSKPVPMDVFENLTRYLLRRLVT
jgi:predicted signal transduction protein with EAL and GGDEF domain